jgi:hypothetical protein
MISLPIAAAQALVLAPMAATATARPTRYRGPDGRDAGCMERDTTGALRFYDSAGCHAGEIVQQQAPGAASGRGW